MEHLKHASGQEWGVGRGEEIKGDRESGGVSFAFTVGLTLC